MIKYALIFLLLLLLFWKRNLPENFQKYKHNNCSNHSNNRNKNTLKILLVAGVHGNEPAGSYALSDLIQDLKSKKFTTKHEIIIVPVVNTHGFTRNSRNSRGQDLNREFYKNSSIHEIRNLENLILQFKPDLVLDFHEGWGWHKINKKSLGNTISPNNKTLYPLVKNLVNKINLNISDSRKHFTAFSITGNLGACEIPNTLACYCRKNKINHILVETTGQKNIEKLEIRKKHIRTILNYILS